MLYPLSYGGGTLQEQGTIVLVVRRCGPLRPHGTGECCRILHLHADRPRRRDRTAGAASPAALGDRSTRRAISTSVASTCSSWRRNSAPRSSSTTRTTCAGPAVRRSPRGATASPTPPRPSCAGPWPAWPTRRACTSTWRPVANSMSRCPPASRRSGSSCTATTSRSTSWRQPCEHGVGRIVIDSFDEIARLGGLLESVAAGTGPAQGPGTGDARGGGAHARVRAHRAGGLEVRLLRLFWSRGRGRCRARAHARRRAGRRPCAHRQPGLRRVLVRAGGRGARRVLRPARAARAVVGGGLGVAYVNGESAPTQAAWAEATRTRLRQGGRRPGHADLGRARAFHRRHGRYHALHGRDGEAPSRASGPTSASTEA